MSQPTADERRNLDAHVHRAALPLGVRALPGGHDRDYVIFFVAPANPAQLVAGKSATAADIKRAEHFLGIATLSIITITFIVDLTYAWIDPRVRLS